MPMPKGGKNTCPLGAQTDEQRKEIRIAIYTAALAAMVNRGRITNTEALMRLRDGCKKRAQYEKLRDKYKEYLESFSQ